MDITRPRLLRTAIVVVWTILFALLLERDILIDPVSTSSESLALKQAEGEEYHGIYHRDKKIGFAVSRFDKDGEGRLRLRQQATMRLTLGGAEHPLSLDLEATVNDDNTLHDFAFALQSPFYRMKAQGEVRGSQVSYRLENGATVITDTIIFPAPPLLATPRRAYLITNRMEPGEKRRIPWFDPVSLTKKESTLEYRGLESVFINQRVQKLHHFVESFSGARVSMWLNDEGTVVKEESPAGFIFEKEPKFKAMAMDGAAPDLLATVAVQPRGEIGDLGGKIKRYRLGLPADVALDLDGGRQRFSNGVLVISREAPPAEGATACADHSLLLAATPFIQADNGAIKAKAAEIAGKATTPLARARLLASWVYENIEKLPVVGLPDALSTLNARRGDCNEHAALFAALARAQGIPTRIAVGLTVQRGAFYYHAWNEVCIGGAWQSLDTTTGQFPADLGHIRLVIGEMEEQLRLSGLLGALTVEVLADGSD